eukprot:TRINITY_DN8946_c0_g3_i1.p1 TRINITY_DN8946_c0_g3~~TRINITY_DN8946_c0_g3_i1.p1  ORF type:complete len:896 (-),score=249.11 TRINITY_DN8946_c0_g3_i1:99-2786(-)
MQSTVFSSMDDAEWHEIELGEPPQTPLSPFYSVSRQRARQRLRNAQTCEDATLRANRLQAALKAAEKAGVPDTATKPVQEELQLSEGTCKVLSERPPDGPPPFKGTRPTRPVTPLALRGPLPPLQTHAVVALLTFTDDGMAELRDSVDPLGSACFSCNVFDSSLIHPSPVFAHLPADLPGFDYAALNDMLEDCEPFRAVVAVIDPMRPGAQVLCSRVLAHGPAGRLRGVVAALPSTETPPPFSGPSYGAASALLCLGGETLGIGGIGWTGGGLFGKAVGFADRAAAYVGGWPSVGVGRLAYRVALAEDQSRRGAGSAGAFLFGNETSPEQELARAEAVNSWLKGSAQACHVAGCWVEKFEACGIQSGSHNEGPMWLHAAEKAGRWPGKAVVAPKATGEEGEEGEEAAAEEAAAEGEGEEGGAAAAPPAEEQAPPAEENDCAGNPPTDLPPPPVTSTTLPKKYVVPWGQDAKDLVGHAHAQGGSSMFSLVNMECDAEGFTLEPHSDVLFVADLASNKALQWSLRWRHWVDLCRNSQATLVCAAMLPDPDAPSLTWATLVSLLEVLIEGFQLVVFMGNKMFTKDLLLPVVAGLTDSSVSLNCLAAHLAPHKGQHFVVPYCGSTITSLAENFEHSLIASVPEAPEVCGRGAEELYQKMQTLSISQDDVIRAASVAHSTLHEFISQCGVKNQAPQEAASPEPAEGAEGEEGEGGEAADGEEAEPPAEDPPAEEAEGGEGEEGAGDAEGAGEAADAADEPPSPGAQGEAKLLAFVLGDVKAASGLEGALTVSGLQMMDMGDEGPSMAYPVGAYGFGGVAPRPWGSVWANSSRKETVAFVVNTRAVYCILAKILEAVPVIVGEDEKEEHEIAEAATVSALRRQHAAMFVRRRKEMEAQAAQ